METKSGSKIFILILLIPALLCGIISAGMAYVGLGLIPVLPALIGIILGILTLAVFKGTFRGFAKFIVGLCVVAALVSLFRGVVIKERVAADTNFDSTLVRTQEGIDSDLEDAFGDAFGVAGQDTTIGS